MVFGIYYGLYCLLFVFIIVWSWNLLITWDKNSFVIQDSFWKIIVNIGFQISHLTSYWDPQYCLNLYHSLTLSSFHKEYVYRNNTVIVKHSKGQNSFIYWIEIRSTHLGVKNTSREYFPNISKVSLITGRFQGYE